LFIRLENDFPLLINVLTYVKTESHENLIIRGLYTLFGHKILTRLKLTNSLTISLTITFVFSFDFYQGYLDVSVHPYFFTIFMINNANLHEFSL